MDNLINGIKDIINTFDDNIDLFISFAALLISFCALIWNIVRDLIINKPKLKIEVVYGGLLPIKGSFKAEFIPESEGYDVNPELKGLLFTIVNVGKEAIVINVIGGNYKFLDVLFKRSKKHLNIVFKELPIKIKPYEVFSKFNNNSGVLIDELKNDKISCFWVQDIENKKWKISKRKMLKLIKEVKNI